MKTQLELNFKKNDEKEIASRKNKALSQLDKSEKEAAYSVVVLLFISLLFLC